MGKPYFIPVSSYVFPELASAEAISPTGGDVAGIFVGRGSYPTKTTGGIPVNPVEDVLIVYSEPVTWEYKDGNIMDYPLVVKVPETVLDASALRELSLPSLPQGITAWAYPKTIFFPCDGSVEYLFRTEEELLQQVQRLSPFQETKDIPLVKNSCESFERLGKSPTKLTDGIANEIHNEMPRLHFSSCKENDLEMECRAGACLGYAIGRYFSLAKKPESADSLIKRIRDKDALGEASRIMGNLSAMQQELARIVMDSGDIDYAPCEIMLKPCFRYKGRAFSDDWESLPRFLRRCVDFIAAYSPARWNWFGNEECFAFVRDLWNYVLKNEVEREKEGQKTVDEMRKEIENVCRHFKSPNTMGVNLNDVHSRVIQAIYIVLQCNGDANILDRMSKNARRPDYCLALYGAFKGYSYFPRTLIPERLVRTSANVPREDIPHAVSYEGDGCREEPSYVECCSETELPHNFEVAEDSQRGYAVQQDLFVLPQKEDCVQGRKAAPTKNRKGMTAPDGTYKLIPAEEINKLLANGWIMGKRK